MASKHLKYPNKQFTQIASIDERLSALESALLVDQKYETPWINRSDWTNVHLGSSTTLNADSNVTHNLNMPLKDLNIKILISPTGADNDSFKVDVDSFRNGTTDDFGLSIYAVDNNNIKIQTGVLGITFINDSGGANSVDTENWYYKIIVTANKSSTFVNSRMSGVYQWYKVSNPGTGFLAEKTSGWTVDSFSGGLEIDFTGYVPSGTKKVIVGTNLYHSSVYPIAFARAKDDPNISNTPNASGEFSTILGRSISIGYTSYFQVELPLSIDLKTQIAVTEGTVVAFRCSYPTSYYAEIPFEGDI